DHSRRVLPHEQGRRSSGGSGGRREPEARQVRRSSRGGSHRDDSPIARNARDGRLHDRELAGDRCGSAHGAVARFRRPGRSGPAGERSVHRCEHRRGPDQRLGRPGNRRHSQLSRAAVGALVDVALPVPLFRTFTYAIPEVLAANVAAGTRVVVPFRRDKLVGIVMGPADPESAARIKPRDILSLPDAEPVLDGHMLELAKWMSAYYAAPLGLVLRSILPTVLSGAAQ